MNFAKSFDFENIARYVTELKEIPEIADSIQIEEEKKKAYLGLEEAWNPYRKVIKCFRFTYHKGTLLTDGFIFPAMNRSRSYYKASFGQCFTHSIHRIHSVPFDLFLELSVTSTSIGHTFLHLPQEIHLLLSHFIRTSEK